MKAWAGWNTMAASPALSVCLLDICRAAGVKTKLFECEIITVIKLCNIEWQLILKSNRNLFSLKFRVSHCVFRLNFISAFCFTCWKKKKRIKENIQRTRTYRQETLANMQWQGKLPWRQRAPLSHFKVHETHMLQNKTSPREILSLFLWFIHAKIHE